MQEWEYKWIQVQWVPTSKKKEKDVTLVRGRWEGREAVEKAGQEGWELVSVQPFTSSYGGQFAAGGPSTSSVSSYMFFFKRVKGEQRRATS